MIFRNFFWISEKHTHTHTHTYIYLYIVVKDFKAKEKCNSIRQRDQRL